MTNDVCDICGEARPVCTQGSFITPRYSSQWKKCAACSMSEWEKDINERMLKLLSLTTFTPEHRK